jgi:hypothetical protein
MNAYLAVTPLQSTRLLFFWNFPLHAGFRQFFPQAAFSIASSFTDCSPVRDRRGHQTAVEAVARHLEEATYLMLNKKEQYREPNKVSISSTKR